MNNRPNNPTATNLTKADPSSLLNRRLAEAVDLQMIMKQAHWNVKGPSFYSLHLLFDDIHASIAEHVDAIAERIVQKGGIAEGTVGVAAARSRLPAYPLTIVDGLAHVEATAKSIAAFRQEVRDTADEADEQGDAETADLFISISKNLDKWSWMLEAHLPVHQP